MDREKNKKIRCLRVILSVIIGVQKSLPHRLHRCYYRVFCYKKRGGGKNVVLEVHRFYLCSLHTEVIGLQAFQSIARKKICPSAS